MSTITSGSTNNGSDGHQPSFETLSTLPANKRLSLKSALKSPWPSNKIILPPQSVRPEPRRTRSNSLPPPHRPPLPPSSSSRTLVDDETPQVARVARWRRRRSLPSLKVLEQRQRQTHQRTLSASSSSFKSVRFPLTLLRDSAKAAAGHDNVNSVVVPALVNAHTKPIAAKSTPSISTKKLKKEAKVKPGIPRSPSFKLPRPGFIRSLSNSSSGSHPNPLPPPPPPLQRTSSSYFSSASTSSSALIASPLTSTAAPTAIILEPRFDATAYYALALAGPVYYHSQFALGGGASSSSSYARPAARRRRLSQQSHSHSQQQQVQKGPTTSMRIKAHYQASLSGGGGGGGDGETDVRKPPSFTSRSSSSYSSSTSNSSGSSGSVQAPSFSRSLSSSSSSASSSSPPSKRPQSFAFPPPFTSYTSSSSQSSSSQSFDTHSSKSHSSTHTRRYDQAAYYALALAGPAYYHSQLGSGGMLDEYRKVGAKWVVGVV
ncbi:hypothetical protein BKA70DRAFT_1269146 [Coprinopsis sp. MPI-PUGE-AT-0042]|nr:hypothetical protein BKA70DRAFT_1269146 [Coprinopsis sp. MPI-PUGE-AT-0042]